MNKTLLIIEDDPYVQRYFKRLFEAEHYVFEIVGSGEEGITRAKALQPALILLDVMMPVVNGFQVLAMLKNNPNTKDLHIVMLSNFGDDEAVAKAKALGARDFLIKSDTPPEELVRRIETYLKESDKNDILKTAENS